MLSILRYFICLLIGKMSKNLILHLQILACFYIIKHGSKHCFKRGEKEMPKTIVRENETLDDALRRFKRQVSKAGTLAEARKREFYLKPGLKRKLKSENARRNNKSKSY